MTATAAAIKRLDDLFQNIRLENEATTKNGSGTGRKGTERVHFNPIVVTKDCDIHGKRSTASHSNGAANGRQGSIGRSMPSGLNSISIRRGAPNSASRENLCHPTSFASTLRKDTGSALHGSTNSLRRTDIGAAKKEPAFSTLNHSNHVKRGVGGDTTLSSATNGKKEQNGSIKRDYVNDRGASPRKELLLARRFSTDSLDSIRRNSWDTNRRESSGSSAGFEDPIWEENNTSEVIAWIFILFRRGEE